MTTTAPATAPAQNTEQVEDGGHVDVLIGVRLIPPHLPQFPYLTFSSLLPYNNYFT